MFTQNQVRQLYVANAVASGLTNVGDIYVNNNTQENEMSFSYVNADGQVMRTDRINKEKIKSVTVTPADKMKYTSKATFVVLSDDVISNSKPVAGEDYILNIRINQLNWHSDECYGWKYGVVHTTANMTKSDFYKAMAKSLVANLSRDPEQLLKVYTTTATGTADVVFGTNTTMITKDSDVPTGDVAAIIVDEAEQAWRLGLMSQEPVYYEAKSDEVVVSGDEVKWGVETEFAGNTVIENGKKIADMEWFYHGERGDIYREGAYPNNWKDTMIVNPANKYDTIDIHYYWDGANHAVQKSEKDITIVCATGATSTLVSDINTALSTSLVYSATGDVSTVIMG